MIEIIRNLHLRNYSISLRVTGLFELRFIDADILLPIRSSGQNITLEHTDLEKKIFHWSDLNIVTALIEMITVHICNSIKFFVRRYYGGQTRILLALWRRRFIKALKHKLCGRLCWPINHGISTIFAESRIFRYFEALIK